MDAIVLVPAGNELRIELKGNLAAMLSAAQSAKRSPEGDLSLQIALVAGGVQPAEFGVLLDCSVGPTTPAIRVVRQLGKLVGWTAALVT